MIDLEDRSIIISISCIVRNYHVFEIIPFHLAKKKFKKQTMERKNTWRQYLIIHNDNEVLNQNQSSLKLAWSTDSSFDSCLELFGANPDIVVLMLSPISKKIKVINSVTNIGGSITNPGNQVVGLVERAAKAVPILLSNDSIGATIDIDVPLVEEIKLVRSEVNFDQLDFKPSERYLGVSFALLPSFFLNPLRTLY